MKQVFNGKVYNTATAATLAENSAYNNGNYCGSDTIMRTPKGALFLHTSSNGQDCYRGDDITPLTSTEAREIINGWALDDDEAAALIDAGVLEEA